MRARLATALLALSLAAPLPVAPLPAAAQDVPEQLVTVLRGIFGPHRARAAHAKGILATGTFSPAVEAPGLTAAEVFAGEVPVLVRFSDSTGLPEIADTDPAASPRGMAIRFDPDGDAPLDMVMHSANGFPVASGEEFLAFLTAVTRSGEGVPSPTPLETFLGSHPGTLAFLTTPKPAPESYGTEAYFGVNAYELVGADGTRTAVRFRIVPQAGVSHLDEAGLAGKGPDYLAEDLAARLAAGPVVFDLLVQLAAEGDVLDDPSSPWPEDRELVKMGEIAVTALVGDQSGTDAGLLFLPGSPPDGIEPADPMLAIRDQAYAISFGGRQ